MGWCHLVAPRIRVFVFAALFILLMSVATPALAVTVTVPDSNLDAVVRTRLGIPQPIPLTDTDMLLLTSINAPNLGITDLSGLEYAVNLTYVNLQDNQLTSIAPLANAVALTNLNLYGTGGVSDLSPLSGLHDLYWLAVAGNQVSDLTPLSGLADLRYLWLGVTLNAGTPQEQEYGNPVTDLSPIAGLTQLDGLGVSHTGVTDISVLSGMTVLKQFTCTSVQVADISVIANMPELTYLRLASPNMTNLSPAAGCTKLTDVVIHDTQISDVSPVVNWPGLTKLNLRDNRITDISPLVANAGIGSGDAVQLQGNYLDLTAGTPNRNDIDTLLGRGVVLTYEPQNVFSVPGEVTFADAALEAAVRTTLMIPQPLPVTESDLLGLTNLDAGSLGITNLGGLEHAANLTNLNVSDNDIADLTPISGLANLTALNVAGNQIADLSALSGHSKLTALYLGLGVNLGQPTEYHWGNNVSDLSPLSGLTSLRYLYMDSNEVSDLSPLSELPQLGYLVVSRNNLSDVTPLAGMSNLVYLTLARNSISDISPLAGLTNLTYLRLGNNQISDLTPLQGLTALTNVGIATNNVTDISPLVANSGIGSGDLVDVSNNRLGLTAGSASRNDIDALLARGVVLTYEPQNVVSTPSTVAFQDAALEAAVRTQLGISQPLPLTPTDMLRLTTLTARGLGIKNLQGMEYARNLWSLNLGDNDIADISPLSNLTALRSLWLYNNPRLTSCAPVARLTNLTLLWMSGNNISDITPLAGLTNLQTLFLGTTSNPSTPQEVQLGNNISDLTPIANLTSLRDLAFNHNPVSDVSPLRQLTNVSYLVAVDCDITDISPLSGMTQMTRLRLGDNRISDISPLGNMPSLTDASLRSNRIKDVSPIASTPRFTNLNLEDNLLTDISSFTDNPNLGSHTVLRLARNYLDVADGSPTRTAIETLLARGVALTFEPQNTTPGQIPTGEDVSVTVGQATVVFSEVTSGGTLTVTPYAPRRTGPSNFRLLPNLYFDIHPTATFTGPATVILRVPDDYTKDLANLRVFHWKNNGWETIVPAVDTQARTLTFQTDSFSDFGVGESLVEEVSTPASSSMSLALFAGLVVALMPVIRRARLQTR